MKIENRQKVLLIAVLALIGLWLGNMIVFTPVYAWWHKRSQSITDLQAKVHDGNVLLAGENTIRNRWSGMRTNMLPNNVSLAEQQMLKSFDNWAQQSGATLTGIQPQWKNDSTNYMTLNCRVEASGNLTTLSQLLYRIEKGPLGMKLDSVEFSTHDTTGWQLTLGMQVSGVTLTSTK